MAITPQASGYYPDMRLLVGARGTLHTNGITHTLLGRLLEAQGKPVPYCHLIAAVWPNPDWEPRSALACLRVYVVKIRRAFAALDAPFRIKVIWGFGYVLVIHNSGDNPVDVSLPP